MAVMGIYHISKAVSFLNNDCSLVRAVLATTATSAAIQPPKHLSGTLTTPAVLCR